MTIEMYCWITLLLLTLLSIGVSTVVYNMEKLNQIKLELANMRMQNELSHQVLVKMTRNESEMVSAMEKLNDGVHAVSKHLDKIHGELLHHVLSGLDEDDMDAFLKQLRDDFAPDKDAGKTDNQDWDLDGTGPFPG